ncbi:MAG: AAA family ATPase [bacterium]|nr:AAA family ATPase [bacterium]
MYQRFFGFREPPFRITPDPRFLYLGPGYREAADALGEGIVGRAGFLTLVGEVGTGKTTLVRHLLESLPGAVRTILVLHPTVTFDETLDHLLLELGIPVEGAGKLVLLQRLHEFVYEHTHAGGNVAILFDEAQALEPAALAELQLLADLATDDGRPGLQVLLAGQPELEEKLRAPELMRLRERIAVEVRLNPLLPEEVRAYVQTRIEHAGGSGTGPFTDAALARIAVLSAGTPRVVNVLCDATLIAAYAGGVREIPAVLVDEAWGDFDPSRRPPAPPLVRRSARHANARRRTAPPRPPGRGRRQRPAPRTGAGACGTPSDLLPLPGATQPRRRARDMNLAFGARARRQSLYQRRRLPDSNNDADPARAPARAAPDRPRPDRRHD